MPGGTVYLTMHCVGTDIIEITRLQAAIKRRGEALLHRVFTDAELRQCRTRLPSLAARFAGKEAVYKALGGTGKGIGWKSIEILSDESGRPVVRLNGAALSQARQAGLHDLTVSLSHCREFAVAVAIGGSL